MLTFAWQNLLSRIARTLLAIVGLTIPIVAILGLFSLTNGIRGLMGNTLARMKGLMVMRADAPAPVFSELPAGLAGTIRAIPGVRIVAPEVWRIAPPLEGRNVMARAVAGALTHKGKPGLSQLAETIMIDGEQLPKHLHLRSGAFKQSLLPLQRGGGRYLQTSDVGQPHAVISTKIARLSQRRRHAQEGGRYLAHRRPRLHGDRAQRNGLAHDRRDRGDGDQCRARTAQDG
jgi:putative ABC transport system permease protein